MKTNDVILSYPYSGAFYAFLCDALGAYHLTSSTSEYYKNLFGKGYQKMSAMSLSLAVIYENIIIPGVDIPLPDASDAIQADAFYHHKELGIKAYPAEAYNDFPRHAEAWNIIRGDLEDAVVNHALRRVPVHARHGIISQAHDEIQTAIITRARVICHPGRARLIRRLLELDYADGCPLIEDNIIIDAIMAYQNIFGLSFTPANLDELYDIKTDKGVRTYASEFVNVIHGFSRDENPKQQLAEAMNTAMNTAKVAGKVSGLFSFSSSAMGVFGLVPVIGTATGVMGIASDCATRAADTMKERNEWYLLAPRIIEKRSERSIREFINMNRTFNNG